MSCLRWTNLILAILASLPPMAHVLELPNNARIMATKPTTAISAARACPVSHAADTSASHLGA